MLAGVRPIIRCASDPTAYPSPRSASTATTDGSDTMMPRPRSKTSVLAVPRSTARSRCPKLPTLEDPAHSPQPLRGPPQAVAVTQPGERLAGRHRVVRQRLERQQALSQIVDPDRRHL